jgi:L-ribulose-5-phosphate 3-epimerase
VTAGAQEIPRIGVCSWSLRPRSPLELCERVAACGVRAVQLALDPIRRGEWDAAETGRELREAGIEIVSGMMAMEGEDYSTLESIRRTGGVRPDATWERNLAAARENALLSRRLGVSLVTFHAGFLPHDARDAERGRMLERLALLSRVFREQGVAVALETGQESAETLFGVLEELESRGARVGVNFDPANMILYGMGEPVEALRRLARWVRQIHVKDALPAQRSGEWGREVVAGTGAVDWRAFAGVYRAAGLACDLVIEREAGADRGPDVAAAAALVRRVWGAEGAA